VSWVVQGTCVQFEAGVTEAPRSLKESKSRYGCTPFPPASPVLDTPPRCTPQVFCSGTGGA
jgi:hypothetical protein